MKAQDYDLENVEVKKNDTVVIDFNTDSGSVSLQISKESLLTFIADNQLNIIGNDDGVINESDYLAENLRDVVKAYLEDNL